MSNEQNRPDRAAVTAQDARVDEALKETFPNSDPPPNTPPEGSRVADKTAEYGADSAGSPNNDRGRTETAGAKP